MTATLRSPVLRRPRAARPWWRDACGLVTWFSLLFVVALWVSGGGVRTLATDPLTSLGRVTGLVSADLLLLQVLLMARIPLAERSYGQDELARRHRLIGFGSMTLMLAHIGLISLGYAVTDHSGLLAEVWDLVTTYPGMLLATAGTLALLLVAVTSVRAARRKLRYESWHLLHLYAYVGAGLALPHQLWTGADFTASPVATVFWWTAYALAAGSVLVWRVALPLVRTLRHRLVVEHVAREAPGVVSVYLRGHALDRLPVAPGQFFVWRFLTVPGCTRGHPFSLSAAPDGTRLRITAKDLGDGSARLARLKPGTRVLFEGPYGRLGSVRSSRKMTLIAASVGITPLRALAEALPYHPGEAVLLYRASTPADLLFRHELEHLATHRGIRVHYLIGPRAPRSWLPDQYRGTSDAHLLRHWIPDIAEHDVFVCGPASWTGTVVASATSAGVPATHIHTETFAW
ncbi:ferredoxin reductase family protein [Amycolatopsis panacis]|uniref:Oxidoreductase n=1 Tax=Amycolatopsis panacis TaxID=2340917 RepID=A0A419HY77_9PSEU|nr:ferric reductase-like transmembrane domain-containing protein [Amycolatopsis panacis]RJQ82100.1 oxidoreductase [Amycolatopsis panacis]